MTTEAKDDAVEAAALVLDEAVDQFMKNGHDDSLAYAEAVSSLIEAAEQRGRDAVLVRLVEALQMTWCAPDQLGVQMVCDEIERQQMDTRDLEDQLAAAQEEIKALDELLKLRVEQRDAAQERERRIAWEMGKVRDLSEPNSHIWNIAQEALRVRATLDATRDGGAL